MAHTMGDPADLHVNKSLLFVSFRYSTEDPRARDIFFASFRFDWNDEQSLQNTMENYIPKKKIIL